MNTGQLEAPQPAESSSDAHVIALELMKQLITLASGVLALSATFIDAFRTQEPGLMALLAVSWISLAAAVLAGVQAISAIVQSRLNPDFDWSQGAGRNYASASKYAFVAGLIAFALFAFLSLLSSEPLP